MSSLDPHVPARSVVYLSARDGEDLGITGAAIACPFASGDEEPDASALSNGVPAGEYVWQSLVWIVVLLAIFVPLAVRLYRKP